MFGFGLNVIEVLVMIKIKFFVLNNEMLSTFVFEVGGVPKENLRIEQLGNETQNACSKYV